MFYMLKECEQKPEGNIFNIQCDQCKLWSHAFCNGITKSEYELLVHEDDDVLTLSDIELG